MIGLIIFACVMLSVVGAFYIDTGRHGVACRQVWTYPDQMGWFRVDDVGVGDAQMTPIESDATPVTPRASVEVKCWRLRLHGKRVSPEEVEAFYIMRGEG